jgi:hypothetical protein
LKLLFWAYSYQKFNLGEALLASLFGISFAFYPYYYSLKRLIDRDLVKNPNKRGKFQRFVISNAWIFIGSFILVMIIDLLVLVPVSKWNPTGVWGYVAIIPTIISIFAITFCTGALFGSGLVILGATILNVSHLVLHRGRSIWFTALIIATGSCCLIAQVFLKIHGVE